jgi:hypothetical protein
MSTNVPGSGALVPMNPEADRSPICEVMSFPCASTARMLRMAALKSLAVNPVVEPLMTFKDAIA